MKSKRFFISLCCLVLVSLSTVAYGEDIAINGNWVNENGDRSLSSSPTLIKEGNTLLILSDKFLENLSVTIIGEDERQVYLELPDVVVDMEYSIPIDTLPVGNYYITVMQGNNYIIGYFHVG